MLKGSRPVRATAEGIAVPNGQVPWISRVNRMHPVPGPPPLLARFQEEFAKHGEYLLAPRHPKGRWATLVRRRVGDRRA